MYVCMYSLLTASSPAIALLTSGLLIVAFPTISLMSAVLFCLLFLGCLVPLLRLPSRLPRAVLPVSRLAWGLLLSAQVSQCGDHFPRTF
jgi:hypothetical protein